MIPHASNRVVGLDPTIGALLLAAVGTDEENTAMTSNARSQVTTLVTTMGNESDSATTAATADQLMLLVYPNLRRLAQRYLASERAGHTLQPTAVVNEAYCKLVDEDQVGWQGRTHFFAVGARAMRQVLVDHARARGRSKRGGGWQQVSLAEGRRSSGLANLDMEQVLTLNAALERLAELDPRQARILELRFFAGLTVREVAEVLGLSKRTVEGDWAHARVWLQRELERGDSGR